LRLCAFALNDGLFNGEFFVFQNGRHGGENSRPRTAMKSQFLTPQSQLAPLQPPPASLLFASPTMHLIYLDESGQTGTNLRDTVQPVFVLGALIVPESVWLALE
jgi:hypothetical protein